MDLWCFLDLKLRNAASKSGFSGPGQNKKFGPFGRLITTVYPGMQYSSRISGPSESGPEILQAVLAVSMKCD